MNHRDYVAITKIVSEIDVAVDFLTGVSRDAFLKDERTKRAVSMTVINIGELVKIVSGDIRGHYPEIRWKEAAGFRDVAAHKYQTLNMGDVYETVVSDFPIFRKQLTDILQKEKDEQI